MFEKLLQDSGWYEPLKDVWDSDLLQTINTKVKESRGQTSVYPSSSDVLKAFQATPYDSVRVVILGQDPYHGPNQANGLAFALNQGSKIQPSLRNIYKEIEFDLQVDMSKSPTDLIGWAKQGVLLLNTCLTVEDGRPGSHANIGWQDLTSKVISHLANKPSLKVFMLWGKHAEKYVKLIPRNQHNVILTAAHPSPLSVRGFYGCKHFSQANQYLNPKINWQQTSIENEDIYEFFTKSSM